MSRRNTREPRSVAGDFRSFRSCVRETARSRAIGLDVEGLEPLARMEYRAERALKDEALRLFWASHKLSGVPESVIPSPLARGYRTTTKRRVLLDSGSPRLGFDDDRHRRHPAAMKMSELEPSAHAEMYDRIAELIRQRPFSSAAAGLNYVIIRGTLRERVLILNAHTLDANRIRRLTELADCLRERVISAFVFFDPTRSPYYLETADSANRFRVKRLFGPDHFRLRLEGLTYYIAPTVFSQVNESILPALLRAAGDVLADNGRRLLDFFCGYGLFSFFLGAKYRETIGIDASREAIRSALRTRSESQPAARLTFRELSIHRENLDAVLPMPGASVSEDVILDPPRHGVGSATIRSIARRRPRRVLHVFCAVDEIPAALAQWRRNGYKAMRMIPLDMFAGTPGLEILVALAPAS